MTWILLGLFMVVFLFWVRSRMTPLHVSLVSLDDSQRNIAINKLSKLKPEKKSALVPPLIASSSEGADWRIRRYALYALRQLGERSPAVTEAFAKRLSDTSADVQKEAIICLVASGKDGLPALVGVLQSEGKLSQDISRLLSQMGPEIVPALSDALKSGSESLQVGVVRILKDMGPPAAKAQGALLALVKTAPPRVQLEAALAVEAVSSSASATVPILVSALNESYDDNIKLEILTALSNVHESTKTVVSALTLFLTNARDGLVAGKTYPRPATAHLLTKLDPRPNHMDALLWDLKNKNPGIRYRAALTLSEMGPPAIGALSGLVETLKDNDPFVLGRVVHALIQIGLDKTERFSKTAHPGLKRSLQLVEDAKVEGFRAMAEPAISKL